MTPFEFSTILWRFEVAIVKPATVKIDYPKFYRAWTKGLFVKYGIDQQENQPESRKTRAR